MLRGRKRKLPSCFIPEPYYHGSDSDIEDGASSTVPVPVRVRGSLLHQRVPGAASADGVSRGPGLAGQDVLLGGASAGAVNEDGNGEPGLDRVHQEVLRRMAGLEGLHTGACTSSQGTETPGQPPRTPSRTSATLHVPIEATTPSSATMHDRYNPRRRLTQDEEEDEQEEEEEEEEEEEQEEEQDQEEEEEAPPPPPPQQKPDNPPDDPDPDDYYTILNEFYKKWMDTELEHTVSKVGSDAFWNVAFKFIPKILRSKELQNIKRKIPQFHHVRKSLHKKFTPKVDLEIAYKNKDTNEVTLVKDVVTPKSRFPHQLYEKEYEIASVKVKRN